MNLEKELTRVAGNGIGGIHYDGSGRAIATNGFGLTVIDLASIGHEGKEKGTVIVKPDDNWRCERSVFPDWQTVVPRSWSIRHVGKLREWKDVARRVMLENKKPGNGLNGRSLIRVGDAAFNPSVLWLLLLTLQKIGGNDDVAAHHSGSGGALRPVVFVAGCGYALTMPIREHAPFSSNFWKSETIPISDNDFNGVAIGRIPHDSAEPIVWRGN